MTDLDIHFIPFAEMTAELQRQFDTLDHLAFDGIEEEPELASVQWAAPDWMAMGFLKGQLVTQLCIPKREIIVGSDKVWVAGIGGMSTHPQYQHQGLGSTLLSATRTFMRDTVRVPFGLLICADETRPFYEQSHWQYAADFLSFTQDHQKRMLKTCVMDLPLTERAWPAGEIDLCGLPW
jgi:GNAT superfamily N-acetyltransferase